MIVWDIENEGRDAHNTYVDIHCVLSVYEFFSRHFVLKGWWDLLISDEMNVTFNSDHSLFAHTSTTNTDLPLTLNRNTVGVCWRWNVYFSLVMIACLLLRLNTPPFELTETKNTLKICDVSKMRGLNKNFHRCFAKTKGSTNKHTDPFTLSNTIANMAKKKGGICSPGGFCYDFPGPKCTCWLLLFVRVVPHQSLTNVRFIIGAACCFFFSFFGVIMLVSTCVCLFTRLA